MTSQETVALINLAELLIEKGVDVYGHMQQLAAQNGITDADMKEADGRFAVAYTDPLAGGSGEIGDGPAPAPDPYAVHYLSAIDAVSAGKPGDRVYRTNDGTFRLVYGGVGFVTPNDWTLVETIGG